MALFGKPVYFSDVFLDGEERFHQQVRDMQALAESKLDEPEK